MPKEEVPEWEEPVENIKYIGEYLGNRLREEGIETVGDLVDRLEDFAEPWEDEVQVRNEVKAWLNEILENARALECCYPGSRVIEGEECSYRARIANFKAYNAMIKIWREYEDENPYRRWIPRRLRGFGLRRKYPRMCKM